MLRGDVRMLRMARPCECGAAPCRLIRHQLGVPRPVHDVEQGKRGGENLARKGVNPFRVDPPLLLRQPVPIAPISPIFY